MIPTYFMAHYRGIKGDKATEADIAANVKRALDLALKIRQGFPELDLFIPHQNQEITHMLWNWDLITSRDILNACCALAADRRLAIVLNPVFGGMEDELDSFWAGKGLVEVRLDGYDELKIQRAAAETLFRMQDMSKTGIHGDAKRFVMP